MADKEDYNLEDVLEDATKLVLARSKVAAEIHVPELKSATESIAEEKKKILRRQNNNIEKS